MLTRLKTLFKLRGILIERKKQRTSKTISGMLILGPKCCWSVVNQPKLSSCADVLCAVFLWHMNSHNPHFPIHQKHRGCSHVLVHTRTLDVVSRQKPVLSPRVIFICCVMWEFWAPSPTVWAICAPLSLSNHPTNTHTQSLTQRTLTQTRTHAIRLSTWQLNVNTMCVCLHTIGC